MFYNILVLGLNSFSGDSIIFSVLLGTWLKRNTVCCAYIKEGVGRIPTLKSQSDYLVIIAKFEPSIRDQWALKQVKKTLRFSKEQRAKLKAKLESEIARVQNWTHVLLQKMRRARDVDGEKLYSSRPIFSPHIRLPPSSQEYQKKCVKSKIELTEQGICTVDEETNFSAAT